MGKSKDLVIVSICSDELDEKLINTVKKQFKKALPKRKVAVIGVGQNDRVNVFNVKGE